MPSAKSLLTTLILAGALAAPLSPALGMDVRLLFAGDILLSRGAVRQLEGDPGALARSLGPTLGKADWTAGNLEGAIGAPEECIDPAGPCFPIRPRFISMLKDAGFRAIGLANNHSSDLGPKALDATRKALVQNGILPLTRGDSPRFVRFDDLVVGIVAISTVSGRTEPAVEIPGTETRQKLRMAKSLANLVVVYVHWGSEFLDWPDKKQRQAADWLVRHGADLIVGHHPHVVQKPECIRGKPVFFSLGNLVFDQKYPSTREGLLADCRIREGEAACSALPTHTPEGATMPVVGGVALRPGEVLPACTVALSPPLTLGGIILRPESSEIASPGLSIEASRGQEVLWKTPRASEIVSVETMKTGGASPAEYLLMLERHYSPMDGEKGLRPCVYQVRHQGIVPVWKGTALAWPLLDAAMLTERDGVLCALHRGDSFLAPRPGSTETRIAAYRWKGFGFSAIQDRETVDSCRDLFR